MHLNGGTKYLLTALLIIGSVSAGLVFLENRIDRRIRRAENNIMGEVCSNRAAILSLLSGDPVINFDTGCNRYNGVHR